MSSRAAYPVADGGAKQARRRLRAPERRVLILDAALRTFAAHGYDGAAMDEIAAGAGVSKAVVYDHVASKRELYTHLLEQIRSDLEQAVEDALRPPGKGGEQRVHAAMTAIFAYVEEHPEASRLLMLELQGPQVSPLGQALEEGVTHEIAVALGSDPRLLGAQPDRARQLEILAELMKSAVLGLASWWYSHPDVPRAMLVERAVAVIWPSIERARSDVLAGA
jgi:AcrR family transcriptional regulator